MLCNHGIERSFYLPSKAFMKFILGYRLLQFILYYPAWFEMNLPARRYGNGLIGLGIARSRFGFCLSHLEYSKIPNFDAHSRFRFYKHIPQASQYRLNHSFDLPDVGIFGFDIGKYLVD